jgi:hypothetical protein
MKNGLLAAAASSALLLGATHAMAATILIDNFDDDQRVEDAPGAGAVNNSQLGPSGNIVGGYRDLLVQTDAVGQDDATELSALNSRLEFNNDSEVTGRGWVTYDGANEVGTDPGNVDFSGLGGLDFLDGPGAGFLFEIIAVDLPGIFIEIRAWDIFNNLATLAKELPAVGGSPFVPLEAFAGGIDWNNVGALQFFAQTGAGSDVPALDGAIGSITVETGVIPLPASAFLLLGGFGALGALRARRRKAA